MGKNLVILGAGCAGTMVANKLRRRLHRDEWTITIIDKDDRHVYQPGLLFIPFGIYQPEEIVRSRSEFIARDIRFVIDEINHVDTEKQRVETMAGSYPYDQLIVATGVELAPGEIPGLMEGWQKVAFDFYTLPGAINLHKAMRNFKGGKLVLNIAEFPFKCPVAPLEFAFLADWYFHTRGIRDKVEIEFVTPLTGAFTKPVATAVLTSACEQKNIKITPNFALGSVDGERKVISSYDGTEVDYDMLVSIPPNFGSQVMIDSGISDPMGYIPVDKHTLQPKDRPNVWVLGDGTNVPTSKAGAVAHFQADILEENIMAYINGEAQHARSDGHAL